MFKPKKCWALSGLWPLKYEALQAHSNVQQLCVSKWRIDPWQIVRLELELEWQA